MKAAREHGEQALQARPHKGATPKLTPAERASWPELLTAGAEAYGFRGQRWTCERVAQVMAWEFRVAYHKCPVWRLLKARNWTPQKPAPQDSRRDPNEIAR